MLRAAQPDALRAERTAESRIVGRVGVGAHAHRAELVGPREHGGEVAGHLGLDERDRTEHHDARGSVDRDEVALVNHDVGAVEAGDLGLRVDLERLDAAHARLAHAARDDGRVARLAAV